jgi:hypothetical protein
MASANKQTNMINTEHPMAKSLHTAQHRNMLKPRSKSPIMILLINLNPLHKARTRTHTHTYTYIHIYIYISDSMK